MFFKKRNVRYNEELRLVRGVERARASLYNMQRWHITEAHLGSQIPRMLAELRYRYLLRQAKQRHVVNKWYLEL